MSFIRVQTEKKLLHGFVANSHAEGSVHWGSTSNKDFQGRKGFLETELVIFRIGCKNDQADSSRVSPGTLCFLFHTKTFSVEKFVKE